MRDPDSTFAARLGPALLLAAVAAVAVLGAAPYAGSWNDGSRLAAVESLGDRGTFAIDDSVFVRVPPELAAGPHPPYPPWDDNLTSFGTRDKLLIAGHFYSDKTPVASVLMAGVYRSARAVGLPPAAERPDLFCRLMTVLTSGLAAVVAVWCVWRAAGVVGLPPGPALLLAAAFGLATVVPAYARFVNNHVMLLGVTAAAVLQLAHASRDAGVGRTPWGRLVLMGTLAGLGYNLDLATGPVIGLCLAAAVVWRCRSVAAGLAVALAAAPWVAAGLWLNHAIGGVWKPMNTVPEYSQWPGCPFTPANMTGFLRHTPGQFALYGLGLLFGKRGFVGHDLPLWLLVPAVPLLWRTRRERPELAFVAASAGGTWLMYALFSNNAGGACLSIRWFVPLLAPLFYALAVYLRDEPAAWRPLAALAAWGAGLAAVMAYLGPWHPRMVPGYWPVQAAALLTAACVARARPAAVAAAVELRRAA